jgi:hypothetical protein
LEGKCKYYTLLKKYKEKWERLVRKHDDETMNREKLYVVCKIESLVIV